MTTETRRAPPRAITPSQTVGPFFAYALTPQGAYPFDDLASACLLYTSRGSRTIILIAHRLSTIVHADQIHVMEDGRITQSGTHAELVAREGLYRTLWRIQTGGAA